MPALPKPARGLVTNAAEFRYEVAGPTITGDVHDDRRHPSALPVAPAKLIELLVATLEEEGVTGPAQVALTLVDPADIAQLNAEHLGVDGPTDVLSFPLDPYPDEQWPVGPEEPPRMIGDVILAPEVADAQAAGHAGSPADELALLVVHAGLHLAGHDHAEPSEAAAMVNRERSILDRWWGPLAGRPWGPS